MYNRNICPLQPLQTFDLEAPHSRSYMECQVPHVADFKSDYNSLIIARRGLACETNLKETMGWESFDAVRFDLGPPPSRSNKDSHT